VSTRRDLLLGAGAGLVLARAGWSRPGARALEEYGRVLPATFTALLPIPPVLRPTGGRIDLAISAGTAQPLPGPATPIWGYGGRWPGPTLVATRGQPLRVRVTNRVDQRTSMHGHGLSAPPDSDGHPLDYLPPGASKEHHYPNAQRAGTYWLHDHALGLAGAHLNRGLGAFYLIEDPEEAALGLPTGEQDIPVLLQDRRFGAGNTLSYAVDAGTITTGFLGNALCANGVHAPRLPVAACRYRFRFLNGSNGRNLRLALSSGDPLVQIAADGALLARPLPRPAIDLAPAERCDCIVDFSRHPVGTSLVLANLDPTWPVLPEALRFEVVRGAGPAARIPERLAEVSRLDAREARVTRRIRFQLSEGKWTMNGLRYDPARIDFRPRLGTVEIWELHNGEATQMHPFHQHLVPFQVLDVDGRPPPPELRGWKDTVAVPPAGRVRIIMRFTGFTGIYVFHCHKLEHEDHAMMLQQEVV
jgi:spore coat protein A